MSTDGDPWPFFFVVGVVLAFAWGLALGIATRPNGAYVNDETRICIAANGPDLCLTRKLDAESAKRIAGEINRLIGREWKGLE